ncbi:MAG: AmpG family muropeptide MFS transporter [Calditrichaeota bacterium]|nr:AmpG family muropeptide MFS transporter [Calditrichota bacterium]
MAKTAAQNQSPGRSPWLWVPSIYFAEGIPYIVVMTISVIMYKRMGISNTDIALYTSWLYLPWVIKPLWSPLVDLMKTRRFWIVTMQFIIGAGLASVALTIPLPRFFQFTLAFFWLLAFSSATHDIAADGFYMLGLNQHQQAWFVGVRSTFYRFAMLTGQGLLVILAGYIESHSGLPSIDYRVSAAPGQTVQEVISPDSLHITPLDEHLHIIAYPPELEIAAVPRTAEKVNELIAQAKKWNSQFATQREIQEQKQKQEKPGWWHEHVTKPLGSGIQSIFGIEQKEKAISKYVGNIGVGYLYLSKKPDAGEKIVVNFGRERGDKSINLIEGSRREFTAENWNQPLMVIVQLDAKLDHAASAVFAARAGNIPLSWILTFAFMAALFFLFAIYHKFILPHPAADVSRSLGDVQQFFKNFVNTFVLFFKKDKIGISLAFLLIYRLGEAQLVKIASPFLLDSQEAGGLGLTTGEVGFVYGTIGIAMLTIGGLLGGFVAAKYGLKKWLIWMAIFINLPDAVYLYMAHTQTDNFFIINLCVGIEQFGYGFGFTAYMLFMIYISEGEFKTAHFAITTGFMALGMMIPGMISGWVQELIGYNNFFIWVLISTIPGIILCKFLPIDPEFGMKKE